MKKISTSLLFVLLTSFAIFAQVPEAFNYQAVVRNSSGEIITNTNVAFRISILQGSETGTPVYVETHSVNTNNFGLVNLQIGKGTVTQGVFMPGDWGAASHFIKVEFDKDGGTGYVHLGTSPLLSVPYAFHAQTVAEDHVDDADADATNEIQSLQISGTQLTLSKGGGTVTLPSSGGGDNWGTQKAVTDETLFGDGTTSNPLSLAQQGATINQILKWDGSMWKPLDDLSSPWLHMYDINTEKDNLYYKKGNIGIGTNVPVFQVDLYDSLYSHLRIKGGYGDANIVLDKGSASKNASMVFQDNGINIFWAGLLNNNKYSISTNLGSLKGLEINTNGDVDISDNLFLQSGKKIGIGTTSPTASLHVNGNDGVLFEGTFGSGTISKEGGGTRMMWYPGKAAFRAGNIQNTQWDDSFIGDYSAALGHNTTANGIASTALGWLTKANGSSSIATGEGSEANGYASTAMGGWSVASGYYATALGSATVANSHSSTAIGRFNIGGGSPEQWVNTDPLFEIGNGSQSRKNAMTVLKNGNVGIGTGIVLASSVRLTVEGEENSYSLIKINQKGTKEYAGLSVHRSDTEKWFIGMDRTNNDLQFRNSASTNFITIKENGNVGIGTSSPQGKLDINGSIYQRGGTLHADYVFEENYQLESIEEHAEFMWENKHLPAIPKATTDENGVEIVEVGSHRKGIVEELEKAHIYISQLEKAIDGLKVENENLTTKVNNQESRLEKLESKIIVNNSK